MIVAYFTGFDTYGCGTAALRMEILVWDVWAHTDNLPNFDKQIAQWV